MELSAKGIIGKIETHAELIGGAVGITSWGLDQLMQSIGSVAAGNIHMPDLSNMIREFFWQDKNKQLLLTGVGIYLAGEVANVPALKKGGKGLIEGNAIQHVLYWITHADEGCTQPGFTRPSNNGKSSVGSGRAYY
jgi:hypothetical protein